MSFFCARQGTAPFVRSFPPGMHSFPFSPSTVPEYSVAGRIASTTKTVPPPYESHFREQVRLFRLMHGPFAGFGDPPTLQRCTPCSSSYYSLLPDARLRLKVFLLSCFFFRPFSREASASAGRVSSRSRRGKAFLARCLFAAIRFFDLSFLLRAFLSAPTRDQFLCFNDSYPSVRNSVPSFPEIFFGQPS